MTDRIQTVTDKIKELAGWSETQLITFLLILGQMVAVRHRDRLVDTISTHLYEIAMKEDAGEYLPIQFYEAFQAAYDATDRKTKIDQMRHEAVAQETEQLIKKQTGWSKETGEA